MRYIPAELESEVLENLLGFISEISQVDEYDRVTFAKLLQQCDRLAKTNVVLASLYKSHLYSTTGQFENFERWVKNVELNNAKNYARAAYFQHYVNHGFASLAQELIEPLIESKGTITLMNIAEGMYSVGAFQSVIDSVERSRENNLVVAMTRIFEESKKVVSVMDELQVKEDKIAKLLDCAGTVVRKYGLLWLSNAPRIKTLSKKAGGPAISIDWTVRVAPKTASVMNWDLAVQIAENDAHIDGIAMSFLGSPNEH